MSSYSYSSAPKFDGPSVQPGKTYQTTKGFTVTMSTELKPALGFSRDVGRYYLYGIINDEGRRRDITYWVEGSHAGVPTASWNVTKYGNLILVKAYKQVQLQLL